MQEFESDTFDTDLVGHREHRIAAYEGRKVVLRYLLGRVEYLSIYTEQGEYLGDAVREDLQSIEQAAETKKERRKHIKTMRDTLDDIAKNDADAIALRREEALAMVDPHYMPDDDEYDAPDDQGVVTDDAPDDVAPAPDTHPDTDPEVESATSTSPPARPTTRPSTPRTRMETQRQAAEDRQRSHVDHAAANWVINTETA